MNIRNIFILSIYLCVILSLISCGQDSSQQGIVADSTVVDIPKIQKTNTPIPTSTISETDSHWVEYHAKSIGVSFQYPEKWVTPQEISEPEQFVRTGSRFPPRGMIYVIGRWEDVEGYDAVFLLEFAKDYAVTEIFKREDDLVQIANIDEFQVHFDYSAASTIYRYGSGENASEIYITAITNGNSAVIVRAVLGSLAADDEPENYRKLVRSIRILPK